MYGNQTEDDMWDLYEEYEGQRFGSDGWGPGGQYEDFYRETDPVRRQEIADGYRRGY